MNVEFELHGVGENFRKFRFFIEFGPIFQVFRTPWVVPDTTLNFVRVPI